MLRLRLRQKNYGLLLLSKHAVIRERSTPQSYLTEGNKAGLASLAGLTNNGDKVRANGDSLLERKEKGISEITSTKQAETTFYQSQLNELNSLIKEELDGTVIIEYNGRKLTISGEFIEWFRGFTDAEAAFMVLTTRNTFNFTFKIALHIDDLGVLNYINKSLGIGTVGRDRSRSQAYFIVRTLAEIRIIIAIFAKYNLNTTKHLNYISFTEAFILYTQKQKSFLSKEEINTRIQNIKNSMNINRTNFDLSTTSHKFRITPY